MNRLFLSLLFMILTINLFSSEPFFAIDPSGNPYCHYKGKVKNTYVNSGNTILVYFDRVMSDNTLNEGKSHFKDLSSKVAASYYISDNSDFAKYLYATLLTAQTTGKSVSIQMRKTHHGYMKIDRIWLNED